MAAAPPLVERFALNDGAPKGQAHRLTFHLKRGQLYRLPDRKSAHVFLVFGDALLSWMDRAEARGRPAWKLGLAIDARALIDAGSRSNGTALRFPAGA